MFGEVSDPMLTVADLVSQLHGYVSSEQSTAIEGELQAVRGRHITAIRRTVPWPYRVAARWRVQIDESLRAMAKEMMEALLHVCSDVLQSADDYERVSTKLCFLVPKLAAQDRLRITENEGRDDLEWFEGPLWAELSDLTGNSITDAWSRHANPLSELESRHGAANESAHANNR
jgi:hypothetical protein